MGWVARLVDGYRVWGVTYASIYQLGTWGRKRDYVERKHTARRVGVSDRPTRSIKELAWQWERGRGRGREKERGRGGERVLKQTKTLQFNSIARNNYCQLSDQQPDYPAHQERECERTLP